MNHEFERSFVKDLASLAKEIELCDENTLLWQVPPGVTNSIGNLSQHLIGNLNHYIGATIGHTGYVRNREAEFSERYFTKAELIAEFAKTSEMVQQVLGSITEEQLNEIYPYETFGYSMTTNHMITKLASHLGYHLGQINYLRRIAQGSKS
ncbi:DinB family protein [Fluviicola sp.]|uniref:DinB family protein n=1 Tax=Fluviicola sp. TaxID=1917219 RepID=UPI002627DDBF|nr:DinB family protein [Fluviicola sp.]